MTRLSARTAYYGSELLLSVGMKAAFTVSAVYFVTDVGMNPFQLVMVGTLMELTILLFEVPTGVVADLYGRRLSLVVGWVIFGSGIMLAGSIESVWAVWAGWVVWGFGYTFTSGAHEAWITDEVGADRVGVVFARGHQAANVGGLVGIGVGVAVASWDLGAALVVGGGICVLVGLAALVLMPETGWVRPARTEPTAGVAARTASVAGQMRSTAGAGVRFVRARPLLLLILAITFFAGASTESYDRLWEAHLIRDVGLPSLAALEPVVWFGLLGVVSMLLGIVAAEVVVRRFERVGQEGLARWLLVITVVQVAVVLAFAFAGPFWLAVGAVWAYGLTRSVAAPVSATWLNAQITDSRVRATVISLNGQSDALGQILGGPGVGALGVLVSLRAALVAGAALLVPAIGLYARALRHGGVEPELDELPAPR